MTTTTWLSERARPFQDDESSADGDDLRFIAERLEGTQIVGIGEATHGGDRESYRLRHRLIRLLVEDYGFTGIVFERGLPELAALDRHMAIQTDLRIALRYLYPWVAAEMLGTLEWVRHARASTDGPRVLGLDMRSPAGLDQTRAYLVEARLHDLRGRLEDLMSGIDATGAGLSRQWAEQAQQVFAEIDQWAVDEPAPVRANIRNVAQFAEFVRLHESEGGSAEPPDRYRSRAMADNVEFALDTLGRESKIVIWGHNNHISLTRRSMGSYLRERYADRYVAIGSHFYDGAYCAARRTADGSVVLRQSVHNGPTAPDGSVEAELHQVGMPRFVLDLGDCHHPDTPAFLVNPTPWRHTDDVWVRQQFVGRTPLRQVYDLVVYFDRVSPAATTMPELASD